MFKRTVTAVIGVLLAGGALVAASPQAQAAPCSGSSCVGRNPTIGCDADGVTLRYHDYTAENSARFRVEVRYSRACNAAWGRQTVWSGNNVSFALSAWNPGAPSQGTIGINGNTTWTGMIDGRPLDCAGTQFYVNGRWVRWYYIGCS
ncbi:MAG: hypothetical protein QG608_2519 [Actinomycetota bacterium]|nr:hypothetical protein [Actinomycetota bacterium]